MERLSVFVAGLVLILSGCIDAPANGTRQSQQADDCPASATDPGASSGRLVRVYLGNDAGKDTCVNVLLEGQRFISRDVRTAPENLHAAPSAVGDTHWAGETLTVKAEDSTFGMTAEKEVRLTAENHIVVLVQKTGITIQVYDREPQFA